MLSARVDRRSWLGVLIALPILFGAARPYPPHEKSPRGNTTPSVAFAAATQETVYYGGTRWDPVDGRWEALADSVWTFESGVGSSFDPGYPERDPGKNPAFHSTMEGWIGYDALLNEARPWRLVDGADPRWDPSPCLAGLSGTAAWLGLFSGEADSLCYAGGQGYGRDWNAELAKGFWYPGSGDVVLEFDYAVDTEAGFDRLQVSLVWGVGSAPGGPVTGSIVRYLDGHASGTFAHTFSGLEVPAAPDSVWARFVFTSDGSYDDQDGLSATTCGALVLDNVRISGAWSDTTDFEAGWNGWGQGRLGWWNGNGGEFSHLVDLADLPPISPGTRGYPCSIADSVLVFARDSAPYRPLFQHNLAFSPWIDLAEEGLSGSDVVLVAHDFYQNLDLGLDYTVLLGIEWEQPPCPPQRRLLEIVPVNWNYDPHCTSPTFTPTSRYSIGPASEAATAVRVVVGFRTSDCCTPEPGSTPWFDNIRLAFAGQGTAGPPDTPGPSTHVLRTYPNPVRPGGRMRLDLDQHVTGRLELFDIAGRRLWSRAVRPGESIHAVDDGGRPLGAGIYHLRLRTGTTSMGTKIVVFDR
jgi:hypothetical protein